METSSDEHGKIENLEEGLSKKDRSAIERFVTRYLDEDDDLMEIANLIQTNEAAKAYCHKIAQVEALIPTEPLSIFVWHSIAKLILDEFTDDESEREAVQDIVENSILGRRAARFFREHPEISSFEEFLEYEKEFLNSTKKNVLDTINKKSDYAVKKK